MENTLTVPITSSPLLRSFKPIADENARVLILGSMPGPEALRKQQYYGFEGNHFWAIIPQLLDVERPARYEDRIALVKSRGIALWDVLQSCIRPGALDSAIRDPKTNKIPELLKKYRQIQAVFVNGRYAHGMFIKHFGNKIDRPHFYLPSTSPANAAMPLQIKVQHWSLIKKYLV